MIVDQPNGKTDVLKKAIEASWIYPLDGTPLLAFAPPMTYLIGALRGVFIKNVAVSQKFREWIFPRIIPEEVLAKTGWLTNHREEAWFVDPKREFTYDPDEDSHAATLYPKATAIGFPEAVHPYALDPIQCVSLYHAYYRQAIEKSKLPIKVFEHQGGWTHRNERRVQGLVRGVEFLRLEFVWIATQESAINIRNEVLGSVVEQIGDHLELEVRLAAGDSCFDEADREYKLPLVVRERIQDVYQEAAVDVLTFYGTNTLEIASAARHQHLAKRFGIRVQADGGKTEDAWSGCLGIGLTRLAAAFLDKHGFEVERWPKYMQTRFKELDLAS
jgi:seryl-tRNA synthetase